MVAQPNSSAMRTAAMYILHCCRTCASVSSVASSVPQLELHAARQQPIVHGARLGIGHGPHLGIQRRLAQALLVDAQREEQLVGDDGVVHAHAAFVEDAHDGALLHELLGELDRRSWSGPPEPLRGIVRLDMRGVVLDRALVQPGAQSLDKELVGEILAPQRAVLLARFGEAAVEVEHPHQPRPRAAPVGHGQDRALMLQQPGQHVMAILPDRFGHDRRAHPWESC